MARRTRVNCELCNSFRHTTRQHIAKRRDKEAFSQKEFDRIMNGVDTRLCIINTVNSVYHLLDMEKVGVAARILQDVRPTLIMEKNKQAGKKIHKAWKELVEAIVLIDKDVYKLEEKKRRIKRKIRQEGAK